ncbi:IS3 family transposase [Paenibacillus lautus]|uniref:IS3 family transposase n=1 Tax=Paenibacillus lautus TaxID=1401 RepID=UPI00398B416C
MGEIRKTYDIEFKRKAVAMFLEEGPTEEELIMAIEQYIYFYNHERFQQKLNNLSPIEFRTKVA